MKAEYSDHEEFAVQVQNWLGEVLPQEMRYKYSAPEHATKESTLWWMQTLSKKGWLVPGYPQEFGGQDWTIEQHFIFAKECHKAGAPEISAMGPYMAGPVIYSFGNDDQKKRFLTGIIEGTELWCQGYSEPGAGSDLASLKTTAIRDGDDYIINGQKIWTSCAHWADWMFCLVKTDTKTKPQAGISFIIIDMKTPGVEVRPIISIDGRHHLNEVYLTDVRVPVANLIGEENKGWTYSKFLLGNERLLAANSSGIREKLRKVKTLVNLSSKFDSASYVDPDFLKRVSEAEMRLEILEMTEACAREADPQSLDGMKFTLPLKLVGTTLMQDVDALAIEMCGLESLKLSNSVGMPDFSNETSFAEVGPPSMKSYLFGRSHTIYGGTSEIHKNIIAKVLFGF